MKKLFISGVIALSATLLLSGCVAAIGNSKCGARCANNLGQQLVDLKKAKDTGAITDAEYEAQKAKLLRRK